jgi:hypothetical protein
MKLCMFHPAEAPMDRGWVGRVDGEEVVHLAAQTLQHLFSGGGTARDHARYRLTEVELLLPLPSPPSVRVFDGAGSFEFANPAALAGPGAAVTCPPGTPVVADIGLAGLVGLDDVVALSPVARLRAPELTAPKDRDFAIVLGPWFTTVDEAPVSADLTVTVEGARSEATFGGFDWEAARRFAAENARLRVGDLLVAPPALVVGVPARSAVVIDVEGHGTLSFIADAQSREHEGQGR